jgi:N6-adenosine-specific RNA methylase IME4
MSINGVKKVLKSDPELAEKCKLKKEENTVEVLAHMDKRKKDVCAIIDLLLEAIQNPEKIAATPLNQLATTMGIVIDKFTANELANAAETRGNASLADTIRAAYEKRVAEGGGEDA